MVAAQRKPEPWRTSTPVACDKCGTPARVGVRRRGRVLCLACAKPGQRATRALAKTRVRGLNADGKRRICGRRWRERTKPGILARDGQCVWRAMGMAFSPACSASGVYTADHILPWHLGGADEHDPLNLVNACVECNYARSNQRLTSAQEQAALLIAAQRTAQMEGYHW